MAEKKSFIFYADWADALAELPADMAGEIIQRLCMYFSTGELVKSENPAVNGYLVMMCRRLDSDAEKYTEKVERANNARKKRAKEEVPDEEQSDSNIRPENSNIRKNISNIRPENSNIRKNDSNIRSDNVNDNVNDNVLSLSERESSARVRAGAPPEKEMREYCREQGVDPDLFLDYYGSRGWMLNGEPVRDWRALIRCWKKREKGRSAPKKTGFSNFEERDYDFEKLEKALIGR